MSTTSNPFLFDSRSNDDVLDSKCRFKKHKDELWRDVVHRDPEYVVWLGDEGHLEEDEMFMMDLAEERMEEEDYDEFEEDDYTESRHERYEHWDERD